MANVSTIRPDSMKIPLGYPTMPAPGKLQLLYNANSEDLYHRLSPYGSDTFLGIKTREPFFYTYPDEKIGTMQKEVKREFPMAAAITDAERMVKFLSSGKGVLFLAKQFLLQTGQPFNETRIYNPTSPIVAAGMSMTFGLVSRPMRHIDISSVGGVVSSLLGDNIGGFFNQKTIPPAGTTGYGALSAQNQNAGKGLIRAGTANQAKSILTNKWSPSTGVGSLGVGKFLSETIKGLFGNFIPQRQLNVKYRSDEATYELMIGSYSGNTGIFSYQGVNGFFDGLQQFWYGGSTGIGNIRPTGKVPLNHKKIYITPEGQPRLLLPSDAFKIDGKQVGYNATPSGGPLKYGDFVGKTKNDDWEGSDVLIQHSLYTQSDNAYPSKFVRKTDSSYEKWRESLQKVMDNIGNINYKDNYIANAKNSSILPGKNEDVTGYNRIAAMKKHNDVETQYKHSVLQEYRESRVPLLETQHSDIYLSKKMASSRQVDGINTLFVLDSDRKIKDTSRIPGWEEWHPYIDDQIAFYFYDLVNSKYIPFRATVKGIQETDSANWEEMSFIGRADRLYSYGGFNRALTFSFRVQISSIYELAPTYQRINYLMSLVKPANYTKADWRKLEQSAYTKYVVPPMILLTIGDLYTKQPIVIGTIGITVPDEAIWETLSEYNVGRKEWYYLVNYIKAPKVGKLFGQLPMTVDISVNCYLLEKERAIVGAAHFGDAPHKEEYKEGEYQGKPTEFHKNLVVYQSNKL